MDEQASFETQAVLPPRRASRSRLAVLIPAMAFAIVAWAGLSGRGSSAAVADGQPSASTASTGQAVRAPPLVAAPGPAIAIPLWPEQVLGIDVRTVRDITSTDLADQQVIAVAGWYEAGTIKACPLQPDVEHPRDVLELGVVSDTETFCARSGLLFAASPEAGTGGNATYRSENSFKNTQLPALSVAMRPGIALPAELTDAGEEAVPAVLIGRLGWPFEGCARFVTRCRQALLVDRVIWVAGLGQAQTTSILPSLLDPGPLLTWHRRDRLAEVGADPRGTILMETLIDLPTLAAVDADAAAQVAASSPDVERIWYRRTLGLDPARDAPRWIAIDYATGEVLGSGIVGVEPGPRLPADGVNVIVGGGSR